MMSLVLVGGAAGCAFFVALLNSSWCCLIGAVLCFISDISLGFPIFRSLLHSIITFIFLIIISRILYLRLGDTLSIWSSLFLRDDEWVTALNNSLWNCTVDSFQVIFSFIPIPVSIAPFNAQISDSSLSVHQHIHCVMCYVGHLPSKSQLASIVSSVITKYPSLRTVPIVGDIMIHSSFPSGDQSTYDERKVADHIHECRFNKTQIDDLDEILCNKIPLNLSRPWWDIVMVTPEVENDERALDPQHAMMCVVVFRFHQSIIDLPTIKQMLHGVSSEFLKLSGMEDENERRRMSAAAHSIFGNIPKYPSAFNLSPIASRSQSPKTPKRRSVGTIPEGLNEQWIDWIGTKSVELQTMCIALVRVLRMFWVDEGNVFEISNGYSGTKLITESCDDTALMKVQRAAKASFEDVGRACLAGALLRYFQDLREDGGDEEEGADLGSARILESFCNLQCEGEIGWISKGLRIGDDYQTARARLMAMTYDDVQRNQRIAFWINIMVKGICAILPDLVAKKIICQFMQHHTMEVVYFEYRDAFYMGADPVEDIRVFKTNMCIPCLCISSYNEHISLDMTFSSIAVRNPAGLIQGFLAELEQLQAMFR